MIYEFAMQRVNFEALEAAFRTAFGDDYRSLTYNGRQAFVEVAERVPRADVQAIVDTHDPDALTPAQQDAITRRDKARAAASLLIAANTQELADKLAAARAKVAAAKGQSASAAVPNILEAMEQQDALITLILDMLHAMRVIIDNAGIASQAAED